MTEFIFIALLSITMGAVLGKALRTLNPFYILLAVFLVVFPYFVAFANYEYSTLAHLIFALGVLIGIFQKSKPPNFSFSPLGFLLDGLRLASARRRYNRARRMRKGHWQAYREQEEEIFQREYEAGERVSRERENFHREAERVAEDLKHQKAEAEEHLRQRAEEVRRQQAQAEAEISRQEEELQRRKEAFHENKGSTDNHNTRKLNPEKLSDAYRILEVESGLSLGEYKRAYREMLLKYHPDRTAHLGEEFRELAEERVVLIQKAWGTVQKSF